MANNKYAGYTPKKEETLPNKGIPGSGNRLDRVNPYEFRKGMDYELVDMGCSRLAESTVEERETATEKVLKNLKEHGGYYSALIQFEGGMNQAGKIDESSFKKYLENYTSERGDGMKEVKRGDKETKHKDDKMDKPKNVNLNTIEAKTIQPLKEAITQEIKNILSEAKKDKEDKEVSDDDTDKKASKGAKGKEKALAALDKEIEKLKSEKDKNKDKLSAPLKRYKDGKLTADEYRKLSDAIVKRNKEIVARLGEIDKEKEAISLNEKLGRREVAKTMMEKDTHMAILEIIKEYGISLREGSQGVKAYYEIAKTAYQEGYMEGLQKN
jgi:hypothetical protein|tara:strand:- start:561 stop:1538 length:978 start_codon:yes stop_codon:yes gene_type:complete